MSTATCSSSFGPDDGPTEFPDDGCDYDQFFLDESKMPKNFKLIAMKNEDAAELAKNPIFTAELECPLAQMQPEEREMVNFLLQDDLPEDDEEEVEDTINNFVQTALSDGFDINRYVWSRSINQLAPNPQPCVLNAENLRLLDAQCTATPSLKLRARSDSSSIAANSALDPESMLDSEEMDQLMIAAHDPRQDEIDEDILRYKQLTVEELQSVEDELIEDERRREAQRKAREQARSEKLKEKSNAFTLQYLQRIQERGNDTAEQSSEGEAGSASAAGLRAPKPAQPSKKDSARAQSKKSAKKHFCTVTVDDL